MSNLTTQNIEHCAVLSQKLRFSTFSLSYGYDSLLQKILDYEIDSPKWAC